MALQLGALRNALLEAGASEDKADRAAEEVASYETRLASIESRLSVLTWMAGANITLVLLILGSQLTLWAKLSELATRLR